MKINPCEMYTQKIYEINERINSHLSSVQGTQNFYLALRKAQSLTQSQSGGEVQSTKNAYGVIDLDYTGSAASGFESEYDSIISSKAKRYGVSEALVKSVIKAESDFNPTCVSSAGAMGLMQLMPVNVKELNVQDPFDPEQNIDGGIRELKGYLNSYNGDVKLALAAYNCGPTRVRRLGLNNLDDSEQFAKLPKETQNYITKIMKYLNQ